MSDIAKVSVDVAGGSGTIIAQPKQFRTGSRGFYGQGKTKAPDGRRFQITVIFVEIGTKNKTAA